MSPNVNEVHGDEEDIELEKDEELDHDREIALADEEGNVNPLGSMKNVIETHLQVNKSLVSRSLLRCKKLKAKEGNVLKLAMEPLPIPLQALFF